MHRAITLIAILIAVFCILECQGHYYASRICRPGRKRYNWCRELCECFPDGSGWGNCVRQRKEFTTMSRRERKRYVKAIKTLSSNKYSKLHNIYNELITNHSIMFMSAIHNKIHFLTWHRLYLLKFENLLRRIDCRITVPYWDWSAASGDPWGSEPDDLWYSGSTGFGGNGNPNNNYCVSNGPFSGNWKPVPSVRPRCNRRRFNGHPPDSIAILELLEYTPENFTDFEMTLRVMFHNTVHCLIGGVMCSIDSSAAPEFFLHHAFVDKIWADWQNKSEKHKYCYFQELTDPLPGTSGLLPKVAVDNNNLFGNVRVDYLDINDTEIRSLKKRLKRLSRKKLRELKRNDFDDINEDSMRLFRVKQKEKVKARARGKRFRPKNRKDRRKMRSRKGRRLGFDKEDLDEIERKVSKAKNAVQGMRMRYKIEGKGRPRKVQYGKGERRPKAGSRNTQAPSKEATTPSLSSYEGAGAGEGNNHATTQTPTTSSSSSYGGAGAGESSNQPPSEAATTASSSSYGSAGAGVSNNHATTESATTAPSSSYGSAGAGESSNQPPSEAATTASSSSYGGAGAGAGAGESSNQPPSEVATTSSSSGYGGAGAGESSNQPPSEAATIASSSSYGGAPAPSEAPSQVVDSGNVAYF